MSWPRLDGLPPHLRQAALRALGPQAGRGPVVVATTQRKYHNEPKEYKGVLYDSTYEALFAQELDLAMHAKAPHQKVVAWEYHQVFDCLPGAEKKNRILYEVDFTVHYADGHIRYIDTKGYETAEFRMKMKLMRHFHPEIRIEVIHQSKR